MQHPDEHTGDLDQHFLRTPTRIDALIRAAELMRRDRVAELGAGVGTVAARIPRVRSLTLVELDPRLANLLHVRFSRRPGVEIVTGDALQWLEQAQLPDVIISNLPGALSTQLLDALARIFAGESAEHPRSAVVTVPFDFSLRPWRDQFTIAEVEVLSGLDFSPPQRQASRVLRLDAPHPA